MNKKLLQDFQRQQKEARQTPDKVSMQKVSAIKDSYVKRDELLAFKQELIGILEKLNSKVEAVNTSATSGLNESKFQLSQSINKTKSEIRASVETRLKEVEAELESSIAEIEGLKNNGMQNIDEVLKKINFPVQRSVNIPVPIDQGGTGAASISGAQESLEILTETEADTLYSKPGLIIRVPDDGTNISYVPSADTDAARGVALQAAVTAHAAGDLIVVGPGNYATTSSLTLLSGVSMVGIGTPTITATGLTTPAIIVGQNNIIVENFKIVANLACVGRFSNSTPYTATGIILRNLICSISGAAGDCINWSRAQGTGNDENTIQADIFDCKLESPAAAGGAGFGLLAWISATAHIRMFNCTVFGDTDGILVGGNASGLVEVFGGTYESTLDAVTSGGPEIFCNYVKARGDQADFYGDSGNVTCKFCDFRPGMNVGLVQYTTHPFMGDITPNENDTASLGVSGNAWEDLFLASGGTVNFNGGDVVLTHSSNLLTQTGGKLEITPDANSYRTIKLNLAAGTTSLQLGSHGTTTFSGIWPGNVTASDTNYAFIGNGSNSTLINVPTGGTIQLRIQNSTTARVSVAAAGTSFSTAIFPLSSDSAAIGSTSLMWSDLFLASGAVINFNAGNVTITHSAGVLTVDGAGMIFNEASADLDFRIESNGNTHMFFLDGGTDRIGINEATPDAQLHSTINSSTVAPLKLEQSNNTLNTPAIEFTGSSNVVSVDGTQGGTGTISVVGPEFGGNMHITGYVKARVNSVDNAGGLGTSTHYGVFVPIMQEECFVEGTLVSTPDGDKPIESIKEGDYVYSLEPLSKKLYANQVSNFFKHPNTKEVVCINNTIKATPTHPLWSNGGWKRISDIKIGDWIMNKNGEKVWIYSIQHEFHEKITTYNLMVRTRSLPSYIANNLMVHNKCPFIYYFDKDRVGESCWVYQNTFLYNIDSKENETTQRRPLSTISNQFVIRELEPETSHIKNLSLIAHTNNGEIRLNWKNRPIGEYVILKQGDIMAVDFDEIPEGTNSLELEASGYYVEDKNGL